MDVTTVGTWPTSSAAPDTTPQRGPSLGRDAMAGADGGESFDDLAATERDDEAAAAVAGAGNSASAACCPNAGNGSSEPWQAGGSPLAPGPIDADDGVIGAVRRIRLAGYIRYKILADRIKTSYLHSHLRNASIRNAQSDDIHHQLQADVTQPFFQKMVLQKVQLLRSYTCFLR